jgi:hypothetical protein
VFYLDGFTSSHSELLRHAWFDGGQWQFEDLDGSRASGGDGRTNREVGRYPTAVVYQGQLHVFYQGNWTSSGTLRHGRFNGTHWSFEELDGRDLSGGVTAAVGEWNSALVVGGELHVWYLGHTPGSADPCGCTPPGPDGDALRHGWFDGSVWKFEYLDGAHLSGNGRIENGVGFYNAAILVNREPHVFYAGTGAVRHAWRATGTWHFEYANPPRSDGSDVQWVSATEVGGTPHVFYYRTHFRTLHHLWFDGSAWADDSLDGFGNPGAPGMEDVDVGKYTAAATLNGQPHVWYYREMATLGHAWLDGSWRFERLRDPDVTGTFNTVVVNAGIPHVFNGYPTLQHASLS